MYGGVLKRANQASQHVSFLFGDLRWRILRGKVVCRYLEIAVYSCEREGSGFLWTDWIFCFQFPVSGFVDERHIHGFHRPHGRQGLRTAFQSRGSWVCLDMDQMGLGWILAAAVHHTGFETKGMGYQSSQTLICQACRFLTLEVSVMASASSGTGSNPIIRSCWGRPWRKAALISKEPR